MVDYGFLAAMTLALVAAFWSIYGEIRRVPGSKYKDWASMLSRFAFFLSIIEAIFLILSNWFSRLQINFQLSEILVESFSSFLLIVSWSCLLAAVLLWFLTTRIG